MQEVALIHGFASEAECEVLRDWVFANKDSRFFLPICGRKSTRQAEVAVPFPKEAYAIQSRIAAVFGLTDAKKAPFYDGMYAGYSDGKEASGAYAPHKDPVYFDGTYTLHCNIVVTETKGGAVRLRGHNEVKMEKGLLLVFPVSEIEHSVLPSENDRVLWVFGFCIDKDEK